MIVVRAADARRYERSRGKQEIWHTFHVDDHGDPLAQGFASLQTVREGRLPPRAGIKEPVRPAEILTYVVEGTLAFEDAIGRSGVIQAGEFQRMTAGDEVRYSELNASPNSSVHFLQFRLQPPQGAVHTSVERKLVGAVARRGRLLLVASPNGQGGSLTLGQDALFYSAILDKGQHIVHALGVGRSAWLHVVKGSLTLEDQSLETGDGAGIYEQAQISFTAAAASEVLLVDMGLGPSVDIAELTTHDPEKTNGASQSVPSGGGLAQAIKPLGSGRRFMQTLLRLISSAAS